MSAGLILGLTATGIWAVILVLSDRAPGQGPWPPRNGNLITAIWAWGLTTLIYVGLVQTWGQTPVLPGWLRLGLGLPLAVMGSLLHTWATAALGLKGTSGWDVGIATKGPYALCRHPQYLGQIVSIAGLALIIGSPEALNLGLAASLMLGYGSGVEDRAIQSRYPDLFAAHSAKTPFLLPRFSSRS
ncbi:methyltransferase family protein [Nioella sediminis]|jgi:protein-S-isoprenylcysteine O-methyltransferase Ste14|uniref:methyltransferase family protein n=1 Tax=Nioella sediminis TaxID=1912092 RepID=UPI0008FD731A|nr:methyltransferase [Nioella sediminis]